MNKAAPAASLSYQTSAIDSAVAAYFADDNDWRVWLVGDSTTPFFGRVATPADLGDGAAGNPRPGRQRRALHSAGELVPRGGPRDHLRPAAA